MFLLTDLPASRALIYLLQTPIIAWGFLPVACAAGSYIVTSMVLEWLCRRSFMERYLIVYPGDTAKCVKANGIYNEKSDRSSNTNDASELKQCSQTSDAPPPSPQPTTQTIRQVQAANNQSNNDSFTKKTMSLSFQWRVATHILTGPAAWFGGVAGMFIQQQVVFKHDPSAVERFALPMSAGQFVLQFALLAIVADFLLYWGHRIQHESEFLWKRFHSRHHQLLTPTPTGTVFIDEVDATLQASLPLLLANLIVQPQCLTYLLYISFHVSNNVLNHSGLNDCLWLDFVTLKRLPFRAKNKHHDLHHRYGNYGKNAKNYAEMFVIWDYLFGTLRRK